MRDVQLTLLLDGLRMEGGGASAGRVPVEDSRFDRDQKAGERRHHDPASVQQRAVIFAHGGAAARCEQPNAAKLGYKLLHRRREFLEGGGVTIGSLS